MITVPTQAPMTIIQVIPTRPTHHPTTLRMMNPPTPQARAVREHPHAKSRPRPPRATHRAIKAHRLQGATAAPHPQGAIRDAPKPPLMTTMTSIRETPPRAPRQKRINPPKRHPLPPRNPRQLRATSRIYPTTEKPAKQCF